MRIHWFQHAPFEGLGAIEDWLVTRGHTLACTRLYAGESVPRDGEGFDWLIVMGGPMNIYQYRDHPWLRAEKELIRAALTAGKRLLGICLGAQLIADVLGGKVYQNAEREIGWSPIQSVVERAASPFTFPAEIQVLHWHGDTFSLPPGSVWLAKSEGCAHQAFAVGNRVLGLQFHLEMRVVEVERIVAECADELTGGRYVSSVEKIIFESRSRPAATLALLDRCLTVLADG